MCGEDLLDLILRIIATECEVEVFAAIEADDVGEKTDLRLGPIAVGPIYLPVDVTRIYKQHGVAVAGASVVARHIPRQTLTILRTLTLTLSQRAREHYVRSLALI